MPWLSPSSSNTDTEYTFAVALTIYTFIKKKAAKDKAAVPKEEKAIKIKKLQFLIDNMNYLDILQSILDKDGQDQYKLSMKKQFTFKYIPPKAKKYVTTTFFLLCKLYSSPVQLASKWDHGCW